MEQEGNQSQEQEMSDIEIAELANKELKTRNAEIAKLQRELAKAKLYQNTDGETEEQFMSKEECLKVIGDKKTSDYDYINATVELCKRCEENGEPNPLGKDGDKVAEFFKDCLEECGGDKSKFIPVYQSKIGADDVKFTMRNNRN